MDRRKCENTAKLTFAAVVLKVLLAGNEVGNSSSDPGGVGTAIAVNPVCYSTYSFYSSVHLTRFSSTILLNP
jgi:hypothetical protein